MFFTKVLNGLVKGTQVKTNNKVVTTNPYRWWRKQQTIRLVWNRYGRSRNCYKLAQNSLNRGLMMATVNRPMFRNQATMLRIDRIDAAAQEHGFDSGLMLEGLARANILLDKKVLADLSIYEPRTFECLADISKKKLEQEGINNPSTPKVTNVITRGQL